MEALYDFILGQSHARQTKIFEPWIITSHVNSLIHMTISHQCLYTIPKSPSFRVTPVFWLQKSRLQIILIGQRSPAAYYLYLDKLKYGRKFVVTWFLGNFYSSFDRHAGIMRWCYADVNPMLDSTYYAFAGVKPKLNTSFYDTGGPIDRRVKNVHLSSNFCHAGWWYYVLVIGDLCVPPVILPIMFSVDVNECLANNGGCESKCENERGSYKCTCPFDKYLSSNGKSCTGVSAFIYPSMQHCILRRYSLWRCVAEIRCPQPVEVPHTTISCTSQSMTHGTECTYTCNEGFKAAGDNTLRCSYRQWVGSVPSCVGKSMDNGAGQHS